MTGLAPVWPRLHVLRPAIVALGAVELDTDLIRLLPRSARASVATRELKPVIGADSYFALLVEGDDPDALIEAVPVIAARIAELETVRVAEYRNPVDFIERFRYLLVPAYYVERLSDLVREIQEETRGSWTQRVEDPEKRRWIDDINSWEPPDEPARIDEVAALLRRVMQANDGSGAWLIGVHPNVRRSNGVHAMAFTEELYGLEFPAAVRGPVIGSA